MAILKDYMMPIVGFTGAIAVVFAPILIKGMTLGAVCASGGLFIVASFMVEKYCASNHPSQFQANQTDIDFTSQVNEISEIKAELSDIMKVLEEYQQHNTQDGGAISAQNMQLIQQYLQRCEASLTRIETHSSHAATRTSAKNVIA